MSLASVEDPNNEFAAKRDLETRLINCFRSCHRLVFARRQFDAHSHDIGRVDDEIFEVERKRTADEQSSAGEQHECQGELDRSATRRSSAGPERRPRCGRRPSRPGSRWSWRDARMESGRCRDWRRGTASPRNIQADAVHGEVHPVRLDGLTRRPDFHRVERNAHGGGAVARQHEPEPWPRKVAISQALDQNLSRDSPARGAQRARMAISRERCRRSRQQQTGHVGAGNQQDKGDSTQRAWQ